MKNKPNKQAGLFSGIKWHRRQFGQPKLSLSKKKKLSQKEMFNYYLTWSCFQNWFGDIPFL